MKNDRNRRRVKGFTLIELIVVLLIIGVLVGILGPTMSAYYRKSRIKAANADAKMVFNAAQTAAQVYIAKDRTLDTPSAAGDGSVLIISYNPSVGVRYSRSISAWAGMTTVIAPGDTGYTEGLDDVVTEIAASVNRTVTSAAEVCWTICLRNYIVQGAVSANSMDTNRVGFYTASKLQATDATSRTYSDWLVGVGSGDPNAPDSLAQICSIYINADPSDHGSSSDDDE